MGAEAVGNLMSRRMSGKAISGFLAPLMGCNGIRIGASRYHSGVDAWQMGRVENRRYRELTRGQVSLAGGATAV